MYVKKSSIIRTISVLMLSLAGISAGFGQAPARTPSPSATQTHRVPATTASVRGTIVDPTGALIPGATVNLMTPSGSVVATTASDTAGAYTFPNLTPGNYVIHAEFAGFAPVSVPAFAVTAGQIKHIEISMSTVVEQQSVTV